MSFFSQSLSVSVQSGPSQKFLKAKVRVLRVSGYRKLTLQRLKMRQNSMTENLEFAAAEKLVSIAVAEKSSREVYGREVRVLGHFHLTAAAESEAENSMTENLEF